MSVIGNLFGGLFDKISGKSKPAPNHLSALPRPAQKPQAIPRPAPPMGGNTLNVPPTLPSDTPIGGISMPQPAQAPLNPMAGNPLGDPNAMPGGLNTPASPFPRPVPNGQAPAVGGLPALAKPSGGMPFAPSKPTVPGLGGTNKNNNNTLKSIPSSVWGGIVVFVLMALMIAGVGFLGTGNSDIELQTYDNSLTHLPIVLLFLLLSIAMTVAETWQRGDLSDFVVFALALTLNVVAKQAMSTLFKFSNVIDGGSLFPTGAVIFGYLLGVSSAILVYAVMVNKTGNLFGKFRFDFTAAYMFFLSSWAFAKIHEIWSFWPNPTFVDENVYLIIGLILLVLESARLWQYLLMSLFVGALTAAVIFTDYFYLIPIAYLGEVLVAVLYLGKQGSITTESTGGAKAEGTNQSSGVKLGNVATRLFVPWDLVIASFWFGSVLINIVYGNQAFVLG